MSYEIYACPVCGKQLRRPTESCVDGHPNTHAVPVETFTVEEIRERLLSKKALQAGADALCLDPPADAGDRNEVRLEFEAGLDATFPTQQEQSPTTTEGVKR